MNRFSGKRIPPTDDDSHSTGERRRMGRVVHDERGAASVEWRDAPGTFERPLLEVEGGTSGREDAKLRRGFEPKLSIRVDDTFNPYDRKPDKFAANPPAAARKGGKRDLKKLSEWMKLMREMEERKKNGDE